MEQVLGFFRRRPSLRMLGLLAGSLIWLFGFFLLPLAYLLAVSFASRSFDGTIQWTLGLSITYLTGYLASLLMAPPPAEKIRGLVMGQEKVEPVTATETA